MASHYDVLGVEPSASMDEITRAYRVRAQLLHPDHHATEPPEVQAAARAQFELVTAAYRVLSDPGRRAIYDQQQEEGGQPSSAPSFDRRDPGEWLARSVIVGVASRAGDGAEPDLLRMVAAQVFHDMVTARPLPDHAGTEDEAAALAYECAEAGYRAALRGTAGHDASEILLSCAWAAWHVLYADLPSGVKATKSPPPAEPGPLSKPLPGPAGTQVCKVCGKAPAHRLKFNYIKGRIIWFSYGSIEGFFCRDCGLALGREAQAATLNQGWWGVISFVITPFAMIGNASALSTAEKLEAPHGFGPNLDPGRPVLKRPMWGFLAAVVVFAIGGLMILNDSSPKSGSTTTYYPSGKGAGGSSSGGSGSSGGRTPTGYSDPTVGWSVGNCVQAGYSATQVHPVPCSSPHVGRIVATAGTQYGCPSSTDNYVEEGFLTYCIDTDR